MEVKKLSKGRRIVIGDIHGCFNTFEALLEDIIELKKEDQLFLLGDYIDKGPRNREVIDYMLELIEDGFQLYPLMGNHEYFVLSDIEFCINSNPPKRIRDLIGSKDLLDQEKRIEDKYLTFIQGLPYYYELDNFILVHAGLDFEKENLLEDKMSMIYARNYEVDIKKLNGKILIHGHTPTNLIDIKDQIKKRLYTGRINLDNGCVYKKYKIGKDKDWGRLCALDLDSMELFFCENID